MIVMTMEMIKISRCSEGDREDWDRPQRI